MAATFVRRVDATRVDASPPVGVGIASVTPRDGVRRRVHAVAPAPVA
jgi:hypothetical protein